MIEDLLRTLREDPRFAPRIEHIEVVPGREAVYGSLDPPLPRPVEAALYRRHIRLYTHQCHAIRAVRAGKNIAVTTPTASGKTMAFNLPVFERLERVPGATALYLYPTKALANDQLGVLKEWERLTGIGIKPGVYDGDTPAGARAGIRRSARIVVSNPHEIHQVLAWHYQWERFWAGLHFVVVDEGHRWRGVPGSHMACLLRRLWRICRYYGSSPQFVFSTATIANPVELAQELTGLPFELVDDDGAPRGTRYFVLYNPYFAGREIYSTHQETRDLFLVLVRGGLQTLCFTVSRRTAELIAHWAREAAPELAGRVAPYRAGYLPAQRREIEAGLKQGTLQGIVATNALELGIDVGSLDAVLISGYPGTMTATWQQAGRAGRRNASSLAALVAFRNPLDQYLVRHPHLFFDQPGERAVIDPGNPYVASGHLLCAAAELPVGPGDETLFGPQTGDILKALAADRLLAATPRGWVYTGRTRAAEAVALDKIGGEVFKVLCEGRLLETMDRSQAFREVHRGAVLLHQGETYLVRALDPATATVEVVRKDVDYHTDVLKVVDIQVAGVLDRKTENGLDVSYGRIEVTESYVGYKIMKGDAAVGREQLDLPPLRFATTGFWFTLPEEAIQWVWENRSADPDIPGLVQKAGSPARVRETTFAGGLHAIEHALIGIMPLYVMCDRWDIGGVSTPLHPDTLKPTVFVYDGYEGGIGLAEKACELFAPLVNTTYELVRDCTCQEGCPACVYSPKCGNGNVPLDKKAARLLLEQMATGGMFHGSGSPGQGLA